MIISESQKKRLWQLFNSLPADVKGHCMRTGIAQQIFISHLISVYPEYKISEKSVITTSHIVQCAREFGFYHHLGDTKTAAGASNDVPSAKERILEIFKDSWNGNGFYVNGLLDTIETHTEHWDGSGYPNGLSEDSIPFWGRVCAIAEEYDIMTTSSLSQKKAMERLAMLSGKLFDPKLVIIFRGCAKELRTVQKQ
jgi:hypothetical protein